MKKLKKIWEFIKYLFTEHSSGAEEALYGFDMFQMKEDE